MSKITFDQKCAIEMENLKWTALFVVLSVVYYQALSFHITKCLLM